jgi:Predicted oxidoreductases (related to aryl-alcohol dehydrogenases)
MEFRKLGKTGIDVSVICLGTMTWGEQNTEEEAHQQLSYAVDQGVNFIDVAELYPVPARAATQGRTEAYIGTWLSKRGRRDDLVLGSKICGPGPYTHHIRKDPDYSDQSIRSALEGTLKRMQTDYLDLYQIHWPARSTNFFGSRGYYHRDGWEENMGEIISTLESLRKEGKIRAAGISNETPWGMMAYLRAAEQQGVSGIASIQNPYNLLNRTFEVGLAEMAVREGIGLLAYSPMAFGLLSGKYHKGLDQPKDRINQFTTMSRYNSDACKLATTEYLKIAERYELSLAQMSLAFINQQRFVTANIIGATSMDQLAENIASIDVHLEKEVIKEINKVQSMIPNPAP